MKAFSILYFLFVIGAFAQDAPPETTVQSDSLQMQGAEDRNYFTFEGNVVVQNPTLTMTCDYLEVTSLREGDPAATVGEIGVIEKIIAIGNVEIQQGGRTATAQRAEIDPESGTVRLTQGFTILDQGNQIEGWGIVLDSQAKTAKVIKDPDAPAEEPQRSTVTLVGDQFLDLSESPLPQTEDNAPEAAEETEPESDGGE